MSWRAKRVVVTGAGGFIGSHLTEALLAAGARVRALVHYNGRNHWGHLDGYAERPHPRLEVVPGDVRDAGFVRALVKGQEVVFHLAALIPIPYSYLAPQSFAETNVLGTLHVLEGCRAGGVRRLVHTSTSEVYGSAVRVPIDEDHPLQAQSPYAATKIGADQMVLSFHRSFGMSAVVVRPFNTYGPRQSARAVIPTALSALVSGGALRLGDTWPVRDFTYVEDTVRGFLAAAASKVAGRAVNLGFGKGYRIADVVEACARAAGVKMPAVQRDRGRVRPPASEVSRLISDNRLARRLFKWTPSVSLDEGLRRTARYVRQRLGDYKTGIYNV